MNDQTITDSEMMGMILRGNYPEVAKQAARYAHRLEDELAKMRADIERKNEVLTKILPWFIEGGKMSELIEAVLFPLP